MGDPLANETYEQNHHSKRILESMNTQVIGQKVAKEDLATLLAMHLRWFRDNDVLHTAPNALVIGPTGVGKTHAIRTAAAAMKIPLVVVDATRLSPPGYQGTSLEEILTELISASRRLIADRRPNDELSNLDVAELDEIQLARRGVVFIDEFDKLNSHTRSTGERSELLQRRLLQFVDGTTVSLKATQHSGEKEILFPTSGLLFVAAGAFTNLLDDAAKRSQEQMRDMLSHDHVIFEDLIRFGFMEELIARFPVVIEFKDLQTSELEQILETENVDPSLFYLRYLHSIGTTLQVTPDARRYIAERAVRLKIGARGLHQVLFPLLAYLSREMEEEPRSEYVLDADEVKRLTRKVEERRHAYREE